MKAYNSDITIEEFVARHATPYDPETDNYFREPFARDTKVGKNSAIYNAHSYHTKVPPEGIVPYILHYTQPGDLVLDPFCGSGMTGVAALMTGRNCLLNDLSPAACHIAYNYCTSCDVDELKFELKRLQQAVASEFAWLYESRDDGLAQSVIEFAIWSDIYTCARCSHQIVLYDVALNEEKSGVVQIFECPNCGFKGTKKNHQLAGCSIVQVCTNLLGQTSNRTRNIRRPISFEIERHREIEQKEIPYWHPSGPLDLGKEMMRHGILKRGVSKFEDFYTKRNLWALARLWQEAHRVSSPRIREALKFCLTAIAMSGSELNRHNFGRQPTTLRGTLYIGSFREEANISRLLRGKERSVPIALKYIQNHTKDPKVEVLVFKGSATSLNGLKDASVDYIFTDPPFGSNIFYSDCSLLWEAWLNDYTDETQELVVNERRINGPFKSVDAYGKLMGQAFTEMYRVLKPGRWASVVFSNSDDRIWQVIRDGATSAGFDLSNAMALDKVQKSFKQIKGEKGEENVVGTDVIMNLHKKARVMVQVADVSDLDAVVLSFIRQHLEELPAQIKADPRTYSDALRTTDALYTVALQELMSHRLSNRGVTMPYIDELCAAAFKKIAGRWYLPSEEIYSDSLLAEIQDEPSAIVWIRRRLEKRPLTFAELVPEWRQDTFKVGDALGKSLRQILEENFWHESETNRWRIPAEAEKARMGDERTLRLKRKLRQLVEGKDETPASDQELLELMTFAYQEISDPRAVVAIYRRLNTSSLAETDRRRASRMYQAALAQTQEDYGTEWEDRQQRLI